MRIDEPTGILRGTAAEAVGPRPDGGPAGALRLRADGGPAGLPGLCPGDGPAGAARRPDGIRAHRPGDGRGGPLSAADTHGRRTVRDPLPPPLPRKAHA
ncbi:hypothetical protein [Streptomyces cremeus]|uniref:Uncharacterized protein n=1 Tax=Streptomyces cremeus TaxID=66881 RepID=A0ABV5P7T3_STRCM